MKRPEGFDSRVAPPAPPPRKAPARKAPAATAPAPKPPRERAQRPPASRGAVGTADARADVRAAARARRREERREVKRFTTRTRRRRLGWLTAAGMVLVLAGLVATAVYSPLLALRHIHVDGTSRLSATTLEKAIDGQLGTPLALIDENRIRTELGRYRLIRSYVTELQPPDTLVVHVVERTPVGVVASADGFQLVDPAGVVVDTTPKRPDGIPLIDLGDAPITGPGFASMAQVLLALPTPLLAQVDTISAQTHDDVTLALRGSSQRVLWGSADDSDTKAKLLADLVALHGGDGPGEYDVSATGVAVFHQDG